MWTHEPPCCGFTPVEFNHAVSAIFTADVNHHRVTRDQAVIAAIGLAELATVHDVIGADWMSFITDLGVNPLNVIHEKMHLVEIVNPHLHQLESGFASLSDFSNATQCTDFSRLNPRLGLPKQWCEPVLMAHCQMDASGCAGRKHFVAALEVD